MRFYIAAGPAGTRRGAMLAEALERRGHEHSFDRTQRESGAELGGLAFSALRSVRDAELMLVLLPGGGETHVELGVAIATRGNKRIIIWSETGEEFTPSERSCAFYFHPCVERLSCPFEELVYRLDKDRFGNGLI